MLRAVIGLCLLLLVPSGAHAEKRVALVIGNSAYQHTGKLANPKNDATDVSAALKKLGFQVIEGFDLDKAAFDRKIRDFAVALGGAGAGVFFFAGHGLQIAGQNYLVPVDAELKTASALDFEMVRVEVVQRAMENETSTNILFLDACRDNPLSRNLARAMGTRSSTIGRGLATIESGSGTLISFSTQPGNVALDGSGRNSPFAGALAKFLSSSNDDINRMLIAVRNEVKKETQGKQVPWENSALTAPFHFNITVNVVTPPASPSAPQLNAAASEWSRVDKANLAELETFVRRHGSSIEADYARARIGELKKSQNATMVERVVGTFPIRSEFGPLVFEGNYSFAIRGDTNVYKIQTLTIRFVPRHYKVVSVGLTHIELYATKKVSDTWVKIFSQRVPVVVAKIDASAPLATIRDVRLELPTSVHDEAYALEFSVSDGTHHWPVRPIGAGFKPFR